VVDQWLWCVPSQSAHFALTNYFPKLTMIKSDYKPESSVKAIFSSSRKRTAMPVIVIAVVAFTLAVWGLWDELNEDETEAPDNLATSESSSATESSQEHKRQELQLQFNHDKKSSLSENSPRNTLKINSQTNKNTTTTKTDSKTELADG